MFGFVVAATVLKVVYCLLFLVLDLLRLYEKGAAEGIDAIEAAAVASVNLFFDFSVSC